MADGFAVATHGILGLAGGQLSHLTFIHLLCFFDSQAWTWATWQTQRMRTQSGLYGPVNRASTSFSLVNISFFITDRRRVHVPTKCQAIILCNTIALVSPFHAACGTEYKLHTDGWSVVVGVRQQCLKRGLSIAAVLSRDDNFKMNPSPPDPVLGGGAKVLMTTSPLCPRSISFSATGTISSRTNCFPRF